MSLESWKAEFYTIPASKCPEEYAIEHSLRKWTGLLPENLDKHELDHEACFILDDLLWYRSSQGETCMNTDPAVKVARQKLSVLELAQSLGNVSRVSEMSNLLRIKPKSTDVKGVYSASESG